MLDDRRIAGHSLRRALALLLCATWATPVAATLVKYELRNTNLGFVASASPTTKFTPATNDAGVPQVGVALVEEDGSAPVLVRLLALGDQGQTRDLPQLSGFIFVSQKFTEGPAPEQTGVSGTTAERIVWGTVTGWFISGQNWCNSEPANICLLGGFLDESTTPAQRASPFYDIGTWHFHGTGFTAVPFIYSRLTAGPPGGNRQFVFRGAFAPDGTVPALPLAGLVLLCVAVSAAGVWTLRRR